MAKVRTEVAPEVSAVGPVARAALAMTDWSERWIPDAFIFALMATAIVGVAAVTVAGAGPAEVATAWGRSFWDLIPFTLQMALVIITGHVLALSPPIRRLISVLASWPKTPRGAVAMVTMFAMLSSWLNWGFSLVFSAVLAIEIARRIERVDYRALAAASFLGLGSVWAQGLSGSASLLMASPGTVPPMIRDVVAAGGLVPGGVIPFRETIFLWQSLVTVAIELIVVTGVMWLATPPAERSRTARDLGIDLGPSLNAAAPLAAPQPRRPGAYLEESFLLTAIIVGLSAMYLWRYFATAADPLNAITLNIVNFVFLMLGFLFHGTPARLMQAVREATPAIWGVILQFPFYAGIAGIITATRLNAQLANAFVSISTPATFPPLIALYSAVLGVFVPSGGSKWIIEAPYVMAAAHTLKVHLGWMVAVYNLGEALANLVQPFWMLPILGLFRLSARDVMGYTFIVFIALVPVVLILVTLLGMTLQYPL